jgi:hypothetical protein
VSARSDTAYRSAALLALLVFLWGAISLAFVPWRPFGVPNLAQAVVGAVALAYLVATRARPNRRAAIVFSALTIAYSLALLPWTAMVWCRLGRPLEAFTVPQIAVVTMPLVIPTVWPLGGLVMSAFVGECLFVYFYAHAVGLGTLIPITEPLGSVCFAILGVSLFLMSAGRRVLTRRHTRVQGELDALARLTPLFAEVRDELGAGLAALGPEASAAPATERLGRTIGRLDDVRARLAQLLGSAAPGESTREAERRLLDGDAQLMVTIFNAVVAVILGVILLLRWPPAMQLAPLPFLETAFSFLLLVYLVGTRDRPSERRATIVLLILFAMLLPLVTYNQATLSAMGRPYSPFLGHRALMIALGLVAATRRWLGTALILVTAVIALVQYFALHLGLHKDLIPLSAPWVLVVFVLIALISSRMREQRRLASVQLLRAETEATALHRRAAMLLALCDRLNTPLQTLVVDAALGEGARPPESQARIRAVVDRLVGLSQRLADRNALLPPESQRASFDADAELRLLA